MEINHTYLLQCSAENNKTAFQQLYNNTHPTLYRIARKFTPVHHITEEILQELFFKICIKAPTFDAKRNLALAWMCAITKNTALDKLRANKSRPNISKNKFIVNNICSYELKPESLLTHYNTTEANLDSLKNLNPAQKQCLVFFTYLGYSHSELFKKFNILLGTVKSWICHSPLLISRVNQI